jgi:hypothetical protein
MEVALSRFEVVSLPVTSLLIEVLSALPPDRQSDARALVALLTLARMANRQPDELLQATLTVCQLPNIGRISTLPAQSGNMRFGEIIGAACRFSAARRSVISTVTSSPVRPAARADGPATDAVIHITATGASILPVMPPKYRILATDKVDLVLARI